MSLTARYRTNKDADSPCLFPTHTEGCIRYSENIDYMISYHLAQFGIEENVMATRGNRTGRRKGNVGRGGVRQGREGKRNTRKGGGNRRKNRRGGKKESGR